MPREDRRITFTNAELQEALVAHGMRTKSPFPNGKIVDLSPSQDGGGGLLLRIFDDRAGKNYSLALRPEFAAAALIQFCKGAGIPIPRRATKRLSIVGDNLCLQISLPEAVDRQTFLVQVVETTDA